MCLLALRLLKLTCWSCVVWCVAACIVCDVVAIVARGDVDLLSMSMLSGAIDVVVVGDGYAWRFEGVVGVCVVDIVCWCSCCLQC